MNSQTVNSTSPGQARAARGQADPDQVGAGQEPGPYIPRRRRTPARPDLALALEPGGLGQTGTPGGTLTGLLRELAARGLAPAGMSLSRLEGTLILPGGLAVRYGCGWLGWPTGRTSQRGRQLHTLHGAHDVAGAARRLAPTPAARAVAGQPGSGEADPASGEVGPDMDRDEQLLLALHNELSGRGVRSVLDTCGIRPRLRIHCPDERPSCAFDNNVIAAALADQWMFCWPWAEPIGLASQPAQTATAIIEDLGLGAGGPALTGAPTLPPGVTSLAAQRRRRPGQIGQAPAAQARQHPLRASAPIRELTTPRGTA